MALDFDGVNDVIDYGDLEDMDGASVWTLGMYITVITLGNDGPYGKASNITCDTNSAAGDWRLLIGGNTGRVSGALAAGTRRHLLFVYDGGGGANADRLKMYIDGVSQSVSFSGTIPATLPDGGASTFRVGVDGGAAAFMECEISHIKAWAAALSAQEVAQEWLSYKPQRTTNLKLWCPLDDGTSAKDYSGNGNHGTVTEAVQVSGPPLGYGAPLLMG